MRLHDEARVFDELLKSSVRWLQFRTRNLEEFRKIWLESCEEKPVIDV
jgi:hypothetical protein